MIELKQFYLIDTSIGERITEANSVDITDIFYGSISPSNYDEKGDNVSIGFTEVIRVATKQEKNDWLAWYNIEENI